MTTRIWADPPRLRTFADGATEDLARLTDWLEAARSTAARIGPINGAPSATTVLDEIGDLVTMLVQAALTTEFVADEAERLDRRFTDAHLVSQIQWLDGTWTIGRQVVAILTSLDDPAAVALLWDNLTPAARNDLLANHATVIANLDGIDPQVRDRANRERITRRLAQLPAMITELEAKADAAGRFANAGGVIVANRLRARAAGLQHEVGLLNDLLAADQVLVWDPTGDGRAVVAWGNVATADTVATFVPGMTSSLANFRMVTRDARRLDTAVRSVAARSGSTTTTATVAWLGYDAPSGVLAPLLASTDAVAERQASHLAAFTAGVTATNDHVDQVVVAHSYGTVLAANAAAAADDALQVNLLVLLGSPGPGTGIHGLEDLHLPDGTDVLFASTHLDPVPLLPLLGPNLHRIEGLERIRMGPGNVGHSGYLTPHTLGADNIARAVLRLPLLDARMQWAPHPGRPAGTHRRARARRRGGRTAETQ